MKRALALILALTMVMALVACGGDKPTGSTPSSTPDKSATTSTPADPGKSTEPTQPTEPEKPAEPKIYKTYSTSTASNAFAAIAQTTGDIDIQTRISGTLYKTLPIDGKAVLSPLMADGEPIDVNGDGVTWQIKLKKDLKWENGEPINADTFMYSWKQVLDPKLVLGKASGVASNYIKVLNASAYYGQGKEGAAPVAWEDVGFKKIDEYTLQITCDAQATKVDVMRHFCSRATSPIYQPLWEQCLSADGATTTYGSSQDKIISSGPFKLTNWTIGAVREFEKNENYARADLVKLDGVKVTVVEDSGTAMQLFEKGEIYYLSMSTAALDKYGDDPRIVYNPARVVYNIEFNTRNTEKPIINNENFRKALYYATNREEMAKLTNSVPSTGIVGNRSTPSADGTTFRQMAAAAGYEPDNYGYDPVLAKQLFDTAMKEENLTSLELTLLCVSGTADAYAEYLQENWKNVFGADKFKLNINGMPKTQNSAARKSWQTDPNGYEICFSTWDLTAGDRNAVKALAPFTETYSNRNAPYDVHTELNALYAESQLPENRLDQDKQNEYAMKMEQYIIEHAVVVPTVNTVSKVMYADNVIMPLENWDIDMGWGMEFADLAQ